MKVTVYNGSPRGGESNSHRIVDPLLEGAKQAGADTEEVFLIERDIQYCRGCFSCWGETPGKCVIDDDMGDLIDLFLDSDYAGLVTPVYGMYMSALLKNFMDRLLPLSTPRIHKHEDGSFYHNGRVKQFPGLLFIANSGFPGENNFDLLRAAISHMAPVLEIYRDCGEILNSPEAVEDNRIDDFYTALREAGRQLINKGGVSDKIIDRIHAELISDEEYMEGVNRYWDQQT